MEDTQVIDKQIAYPLCLSVCSYVSMSACRTKPHQADSSQTKPTQFTPSRIMNQVRLIQMINQVRLTRLKQDKTDSSPTTTTQVRPIKIRNQDKRSRITSYQSRPIIEPGQAKPAQTNPNHVSQLRVKTQNQTKPNQVSHT